VQTVYKSIADSLLLLFVINRLRARKNLFEQGYKGHATKAAKASKPIYQGWHVSDKGKSLKSV